MLARVRARRVARGFQAGSFLRNAAHARFAGGRLNSSELLLFLLPLYLSLSSGVARGSDRTISNQRKIQRKTGQEKDPGRLLATTQSFELTSPPLFRPRMHPLFKDSLTGKVALVTGAGSGIGKCTAKLFGYAGARVAALTRSGDEAEATCMEIRRNYGEAIGVAADVSKADQIAKAFKSIEDAWGRLDIVVANAGINGLWAPIEEIPE